MIFPAWIQYRYVLIFFGFFGLASVYGMRVNINVAMVVMVNQSAIEAESTSLSCPVAGVKNSTQTDLLHDIKVNVLASLLQRFCFVLPTRIYLLAYKLLPN